MTKPRKHAELIKAWADGAVIQYMNTIAGEWTDTMGNEPSWYDNVKYRVKPEPKPDVSKFIGLYKSSGYHHTSGVYNKKEYIAKEHSDDPEFYLENKLELVFDSESKKLKDVIIHGVN